MNAHLDTNSNERNSDATPGTSQDNQSGNQSEMEAKFERGTDVDPFAVNSDREYSNAKHEGNDIANNDGSVLETLDTAFHDKPGHSEGESVSGSNKAGYYEERSYGRSDDEEELDARNDKTDE